MSYFVHARNIDEEYQFRVSIDDTCIDSPNNTEIVDLAEGIGADYLLVKGCNRVDKIAKIQRFC